MESPLLLQPPTSNTSSILARLFLLLFFLFVALYANREASDSFEVVVVGPAAADRSPAARRFRVSYVSNGLATRLVLDAASHIGRVLHSHHHRKNKKRIQQVTLQLATHNLTRPVTVAPGSEPDSFVLSLSPDLLLAHGAGSGSGERVKLAVGRGMARVSVWDGDGTAPTALIEAMAEALSGSDPGRDPVRPVGPCWAEAGFLKYCEERRGGFLGRLNGELRTGWREGAVAEAVGVPIEQICGAYRSTSAFGLGQVHAWGNHIAHW